jgi:hypothetical protein
MDLVLCQQAAVIIFSVEAIANMVQMNTKAVETARQNKGECEEVARCVASVSAMHASRPAMAKDLAVSLQRALELVRGSASRSARLDDLWGPGTWPGTCARVQDDVTRKVTLGIFAANVHQASNVQCAPPPPLSVSRTGGVWSWSPAPYVAPPMPVSTQAVAAEAAVHGRFLLSK